MRKSTILKNKRYRATVNNLGYMVELDEIHPIRAGDIFVGVYDSFREASQEARKRWFIFLKEEKDNS